MYSDLVIKPCVPNPEHIVLRVTTLETVNPHPYYQSNPFRSRTSTWEGHCWEEVIMSALMSNDSAKMLCAHMLHRMDQMQWLCESSSGKDVEYLRYKLENFVPIDVANHYYKDQVLSTQTSMSYWVECGKYLVEVTGTSDLTMLNMDIRDIKYYAKKFDDGREYPIYTLDNFRDSVLQNKKQWYLYPLMSGIHDQGNFYYDLYPKTKNAKSDNKPNNHLKRIVYKCEVDIEKAKAQIKKDIVQYFRVCAETGTKIGDRIERNE